MLVLIEPHNHVFTQGGFTELCISPESSILGGAKKEGFKTPTSVRVCKREQTKRYL